MSDDFDRFQDDSDSGDDLYGGGEQWGGELGDVPPDAMQEAQDAFDLYGWDFSDEFVHSVGAIEGDSSDRLIAFGSVIEALNYWGSDGWNGIPTFAELIYDDYDGLWYWWVDDDTS